jgi:DNA-binding MarR family transcriptional regulator
MGTHDGDHLFGVRRAAGRSFGHLGNLAEIQGTYRRWSYHAQRLHIPAAVVVESVNGATRNAQRLPRANVDLLSVDCPGQHTIDSVDRFFIVVVTVRWRRQALRARDAQFKDCNTASGIVSGEQEAHRERSKADCLVCGIDAEIGRRLWHFQILSGKLHLQILVNGIYKLSRPSSPTGARIKTQDMLIGALLRIPAQAIHRRIISELNASGFTELRVPHMAVLQFPGPDGVRPGALADRAGMSKQAMNQLLKSLEGYGYVKRSDAPDEGRARTVHFTARGRAAYSRIVGILQDIEREWSGELGPADFARLKELLFRVWNSPLVR